MEKGRRYIVFYPFFDLEPVVILTTGDNVMKPRSASDSVGCVDEYKFGKSCVPSCQALDVTNRLCKLTVPSQQYVYSGSV
jgi:hypothetical protein